MPLLGDLAGLLQSSTILIEAARLGASRSLLARMAFNVALEGVLGAIPLAGDVFDAAWKANQRNVRLLGAWLDHPTGAQRSSRHFLLAILGSLAAVAALTACLTYLLLRWLVA